MFELLPRLAVGRPVLTTMMVVTFLILGLFGLTRLRLDLFPDVEFPFVTLVTAYPGAGPEEVETQVTDPLEEAISGLAGVNEVRSFSQENVSIILIEFDLGVDGDQAAIDVRERIESVRAELPTQVETPVVQRFDIGALPIMDLALYGPQSVDVLYELADRDLRERLSRVEGVAGIDIVGGRKREVEVLVRPEQLVGYGLTLGNVVSLIQAENLSVPAGRITEPSTEVPVRVQGEYREVRELEELRLLRPNGQAVRLGEVATVRDGFEDLQQIARYNGKPAVSISIRKRSDANTVATAAGVLKELEAIRPDLPAGTLLESVRDRSEFIRSSVNDVLLNLLIGILLTTVVLFVFLQSWRGTIIAAVAMPTTVIATFLPIYAFGFTLNVMTLMALSITVGILVTNTIVVLESIYRRLDLGEAPRQAARGGTREVAVAVAASTLTNLVVFTPIAFMGGIIGQFFLAFGLTVVFATLFSIFISFTLAPMLAARLLRAKETERARTQGRLAPVWRRWSAGYEQAQSSYRRGLSWALARPRNGWLVIGGIFLTSLLALFVAAAFVGGDFLPEGDEGAIQITLELPSDAPIERTAEVAEAAEQLLAQVGEIKDLLTTVAGATDGFMAIGTGANTATLLATLHPGSRPATEVVPEVRALLADLPDAHLRVMAIDPGQVGGGEAPIQLLLQGPDYDTLRALSEKVTRQLQQVEALSEVDNTLDEPRPELVFRPDRAALADHGVTVGQVGQLVRTAIEGTTAGVFRGEVGRERDIRVRLAQSARLRAAQVGSLPIATSRGPVSLHVLGELVQTPTPTAIQRVDRVRSVQIDAQIGRGTLTGAVAEVEAQLRASPLPPGYSWRVTGEFERFGEALGSVLVALLLAILLTYVVLGMILESFVHPFTIMLTLPLGAVGAFLGLFLWGESINIFSLMAIIMLVGIVVNNAILILDYTARLRREGAQLVPALLQAAPARLRPIVMTNIAIVFALLPQALSTGAGAAFRIPMAVVTMGGVILSAIFTLFLIPVIYTKLDRFSLAARRVRHGAELPAHG